MINLLLISDNAQAEKLRGHFQSRYQIRFLVVSDYDHGLKDVFEKRPALVCIQEQIFGVTGESVARHIQLLLGDSAPSFVLLHNSGSKAKPCPGLFNHLIDISAPFDALCINFEQTMRDILGEKWAQVVVDSLTNPVEPVYEHQLVEPPETSGTTVSAPTEVKLDTETIFPSAPTAPPQTTETGTQDTKADNNPQILNSFDDLQHQTAEANKSGSRSNEYQSIDKSKIPHPFDDLKNAHKQAMQPPMPPPLPRKTTSSKQTVHNPDKDTSKQGNTLVHWILLGSLIAAACFAALSLYLVWNSSAPSSKTATVPASQKIISSSHTSDSYSLSPATVEKSVKTIQPLPSFIPLAGLDPKFEKTSPGWNRYLGKGRDYRIFRESGKIKALQVISTTPTPIAANELQAAMLEIFGYSSYQVHSRKEAGGLLLERATIDNQGKLLVYRTQPGGPVRAFVLSIN